MDRLSPQRAIALPPSHVRPALASLRGVHKRYGSVHALAGIDLDIHAGQLLALLGRNGAGKSTAIGLLLGLIRADSGEVRLFGQSPQQLAARRGIGVMLQQAELPPNLRVRELIDTTRAYYPQPRTLAECAQLAGLEELLDRPYAALSGGQQRCVQFALALCGRPRLLFLDEPSTGLDVRARQRLWQTMGHLVAEGNGVVLTTHYLEEAQALADRVCVLQQGRVVSDGSVDALRARIGRKQVRCRSSLPATELAGWPEMGEAREDSGHLLLASDQVEQLLRRLLARDPQLTDLEVRAPDLSEAFLALTARTDAAADNPMQEVA